MKMGKKVREYKAGDFIFAKVKGYPAWPARVQRMNGKKYFVYFYGTGETANLPPNMIFDYAENKDKFLNKAVKRRDFNDGVKQIEYDFANNVPLEQVIGVPLEVEEGANNTVNESTANDTVDESMADTTAADETMAEEPSKPGKKATPKTPARETPKVKETKTPRGRAKKDDESRDEQREDDKRDEELVSRSGRKIRPKRYIEKHTEENTALPSSAPKKRRGASPVEKDKENKEREKNIKHFNAVTQAELEDLKEPFTPEDPEKENIIIAYLPAGQYVGIKLFQSRPTSFKNEVTRLQWDKQAARNALTLKSQLEKGHITPQSVLAQLVMDLNLTDEEKATLDKDRETEEKKSRVQFLKVEMKLIELDAKIKTCLCLEKAADTELCLKLLDELMGLDIKPLMLLKHPTTPETIKRMRAYVGNTPSWELTENAALLFSQHAHKIRKQADAVYANLRELFKTPEGLSFWEFFMERVEQFKKATEKLTPDEILEMVHEPLEMSVPTSHTMRAAIDAANDKEKEEEAKRAKSTPAKIKKTANNTAPKTPAKRQSSRNKPEEKDKEQTNSEEFTETNSEPIPEEQKKKEEESIENDTEDKEVAYDKKEKKSSKDSKINKEDDKNKDKDSNTNKDDSKNKDKESKSNKEENKSKEQDSKANKEDNKNKEKNGKEKESKDKNDTQEKESVEKEKTPEKNDKIIDDSQQDSSLEEEERETSEENSKESEKDSMSTEKERKSAEKESKSAEKDSKSVEKESKSVEKERKSGEKESKSDKKSDREDKKAEKEKTEDEPRAKRSRESKKTDPPPRSPTKRKSKF